MIPQALTLPSIEIFTPEKRPIIVARFVAYNAAGKILIAQRPNGSWHLPGGKADVKMYNRDGVETYIYEPVEQAAPRETKEETGADVRQLGEFVLFSRYVMTDRGNDNYTGQEYLGWASEGIITNESQVAPADETIAVAYASIDEMHNRYTMRADNWLVLGALDIHHAA